MIFYKETDFRETSLGSVPKNWDVIPAEKLCTKVTDGTHDTPKPADEGYFLVTSKHIKNGRIDFSEAYLISKDDFDETNKRSKVNVYDVLFSMIGTVGLTSVVTREYPAFAIKNVGLFKTNGDKNLANWLHYYFASSFSRRYIQNNLKGTTQKYIPLYALRKFLIALPPFPEQHGIVEVLSVVDLAIGKVDEVIAKTERLKKGLMQELLTKGIGHKEFKETKIGKTPKTWQVVRLGDEKIAEIRGNKIITGLNKSAFIPMELVPDSQIFPKYEIRDSKDIKSSTYCEAGDLLLAKITPSLENGKQGIVPYDIPNGFALATTEVYPIICKGINTMFLFYILKFPKFRKILEFSMRGTTGRQRVPKNAVEKLKIPLPQHPEQKKIAEILSTVDEKLEIERKEKAKLERIKRGLMDLLLTGKVRAKVAD